MFPFRNKRARRASYNVYTCAEIKRRATGGVAFIKSHRSTLNWFFDCSWNKSEEGFLALESPLRLLELVVFLGARKGDGGRKERVRNSSVRSVSRGREYRAQAAPWKRVGTSLKVSWSGGLESSDNSVMFWVNCVCEVRSRRGLRVLRRRNFVELNGVVRKVDERFCFFTFLSVWGKIVMKIWCDYLLK